MTTAWAHSAEIATKPWSNTTAELRCPRCGGANLHHTAITVYDRREDGPTVVQTDVSVGKVQVNAAADGTGNPSMRRDGVAIRFDCEGCGDEPIEMTIAQHKGTTEIGWRYVEI